MRQATTSGSGRRRLVGLALGLAAGALLVCGLGLAALIRLARTTAAPTAITGQVYEGHYTGGFEISSFVPCGSADSPGYGGGWWLSAVPESDFQRRYSSLAAGTAAPGELFVVYVRFVGDLSPEGPGGQGYGHVGAYARAVTVTELLEMRSPGCP